LPPFDVLAAASDSVHFGPHHAAGFQPVNALAARFDQAIQFGESWIASASHDTTRRLF
jgi:hypothetical protein